jgi:predicted lipoprotein with Yx(FWY)xxD motif
MVKSVYLSLLALSMACLFLSSTALSASMSENHSIMVKEKEGTGKYLTDSEGMTLYTFKMDSQGVSACTGGCLEKWTVFHAESMNVSPGLDVRDFGTITRSDGKKQTTYKGWPLYRFAGDTKPGDTKGQGVKDVWFVATPMP